MSTKEFSSRHASTGHTTPPPAAATTALPPAATSGPPATSLVTVALPPPGATVPALPPDYAPPTPGEFKNVVPRKAELTALPQALIDLASFTTFDQTMGAIAPTQAEVTQALTAGQQWSSMCQATDAWMGYASLMQGLAWRLIRAQLDSLRPAFVLAVKRNPKIAEQYAGLAKLLTVPMTSAQTAAATRKANKKAVEAGEAPNHGKVGQRRQRRAEKAALAAAKAAAQPATNGGSAGGGAAPAPAPVAAGANAVAHS